MRPRIVFLVVLGIALGGTGRLEPSSCFDDSDCSQGQFCYKYSCLTGSATTCATHSECPAGEFCGDGRCLTGCRSLCNCPQGQFCYYGRCLSDSTAAYYCCDNPGCPPGQRCVNGSGSTSTCAEDPTYVCQDACDCGPAHCCKNSVCVKDIDDPWTPGGTEVGASCVLGVDATYCCKNSTCFAARLAYKTAAGYGATSFRCFDDLNTGSASNSCGGLECFYAGTCGSGESCVDVSDDSTAAPGASCSSQGGRCVSNAVAESLFGYSSADLLSSCGTGGLVGSTCETGWRPGGVYAVQRVVATVGSCGNGTCQAWESAVTCAADCRCGDDVCDTTEVGSCPVDCGTCGDGVCGPRETSKTCAADCGITCGDGSCDASEATSCPQDCACPGSPTYADAPISCGDGVCQAVGAIPENCVNCPKDCGAATDADGDAIADCIDPCPGDALNDGDSDGLCTASDNCPTVSNPNQADLDGDAQGDACDADDDNDGVLDAADNCPLAPNPDQADFDHDGAGNACDADSDNDGVLDANDQCPQTPGGAVSGPNGCSVGQTCPCANEWKNHGAYVSCVAHASEWLLGLGLIDQAAKDALVSTAARSGCGH